MTSAIIVLEDHEGAVACKLTFAGGFDPNSHAHQHAQALIRMMDSICERQGEPVIDPVVEQPKLVVVEG